jgi:hypothetical protein
MAWPFVGDACRGGSTRFSLSRHRGTLPGELILARSAVPWRHGRCSAGRIAARRDEDMKAKAWIIPATCLVALSGIAGCGGSSSSSSFVVTSSVGPGGTVVPGSVSVSTGTQAEFTITPLWGYRTLEVSGCGGTLSGDTYTTAPVTSRCIVTATFEPVAGQSCVSTADEFLLALSEVGESGEPETIRLVSGTYSHDFEFFADVPGGIALEIEGGFRPDCTLRDADSPTVLDGAGTRSVLILDLEAGASASLSTLTVTNGFESIRAAGIEIWGPTDGTAATIENVRFIQNEGVEFFGVGLAVMVDTLRVRDSAFEDNLGVAGSAARAWCRQCDFEDNDFLRNVSEDGAGGLEVTSEGEGLPAGAGGILVLRNHFEENQGSVAGGLYAETGGQLSLRESRFLANESEFGGGASLSHTGLEPGTRLEVIGNYFVGNLAEGAGGALLADAGGVAEISNNLFDANTAGEAGGAILLELLQGADEGWFINNTVVRNESETGGGGIYSVQHGNNMPVRLINNAITHNSAPRGADAFLDNDGDRDLFPATVILRNNALSSFSSVEVALGLPFFLDNIVAGEDAYLDFDAGNFRPAPGSPLIDAGLAQDEVPETDIEGNPRDATPDIGAYEYGGD